MTDSAADPVSDLCIERVQTFPVRPPGLRSFGIAGGNVTAKGGTTVRVLVKIVAGDRFGWGATPTPAWTYETTESIVSTIDRYLAPTLVGLPVWNLDALARLVSRTINPGLSIGSPIAKSALDMAAHDLLGRALGLSLGELWGQRHRDRELTFDPFG